MKAMATVLGVLLTSGVSVGQVPDTVMPPSTNVVGQDVRCVHADLKPVPHGDVRSL
jgi:hypothetical protein